jgi:hypothetical protein
MLFVPTVSPGYDDSVIYRSNSRWIRPRDRSSYYDTGWIAAISVRADIAIVNSFNAWHEGSVIDRENCTLTDSRWCGIDPHYFLTRTSIWATPFKGGEAAVL